MVIDDKEFQVQKRANVNGAVCSWLYHARLKVAFVCKNESVIFVGDTGLASYAYKDLIESCLKQVYVVEQENIVEGSLA